MKIGTAIAVMIVAVASVAVGEAAPAQQSFTSTATGERLDVEHIARRGGRNTPAVKAFMQTGVDPYVEVPGCLPFGEQLFVETCSGCHGRIGEGKVGPPLNDSVWIYAKNKTDKGIFETIFGGAKGLMGPHGQDIELDDLMKLIAWVRHIQNDDVTGAEWLTPAQKQTFKPFNFEEWKTTGRQLAEKQQCQISEGHAAKD